MWPVSAGYLEAVRNSRTIEVRAQAWYGGALVADFLPVASGTVTIDVGSQVRRTLDVVIGGQEWDPTVDSDVLAPFGTWLYVWSGIRFPQGTVEWAPLGRFRVENPSSSEGDPAVTVHAADASKVVQDARFLTPRSSTPGMRIVDQMAALVTEVHPCSVILHDYPDTIGRVVWESDRWGAVHDMADSLGAEAFFEQQGAFVVRPQPTLADPAVWTVNTGEGGVMASAARELSRENLYNAWVARGEQAADVAPVQGIAYDLDPGSPTRWEGPFGQKPGFYSSPLLKTTAQALTAASAKLARSRTTSRAVSLGSVPNPALDGGDVIVAVYPNGRTERHLTEKLPIPLGPGVMIIDTRSARPDDS